jgi:hypothetical protein
MRADPDFEILETSVIMNVQPSYHGLILSFLRRMLNLNRNRTIQVRLTSMAAPKSISKFMAAI